MQPASEGERTNPLKYMDKVQALVINYNATRHRSIGMAPDNVGKDNELEVWQTL